MNNKGEMNKAFVFLVLLLLIVGIVYFMSRDKITDTKSVNEHKVPADISKGEDGTGLNLKMYDEDGNEITIPDWFKVSSISGDPYTIVTHSPTTSCTTRTNCPGYATNPAIDCYNGVCALKGVSSMTMGVSVTNPSTSGITFQSIGPSAVSPTAFYNALNKTALKTMAPDTTFSWTSTTISVAAFEGTTQTFSVTVEGYNPYTGANVTASDSLALSFAANPTGSFTVLVSSPLGS